MSRPRLGPPTSQLHSLDRALALLELFTASRPDLSLAEAAAALNSGKSTVHRLFLTLEARGYVSYDLRTHQYRLGLAAVRLGNMALASLDLRRVAWPHLRRLAEETGESAFLLVIDGESAVAVDCVESPHPLRLTSRPGLPWALHAGASNKVLLAHLPADRIEAYLAKPLVRVTDGTVVDADRLRTELQQIRMQGYAWSVGEQTPDVAALAVPILSGGDLLGALAVAGPPGRFPDQGVVLSTLQRSARDISWELGART